ncbi:serine protease [Actinosynnema sp. NPDC020468]|uniref:S1 family peptidase n=1 Tax=Actinosynnema sp. NPDC020468 TaxID=3154488 RepID=UPI0034001A3B
MTASRGPVEHEGRETWRVRVRGGSRVLGAGVLVTGTHVLTCAHVVIGVEDLAVDLVELPGTPSSRARVVEELCVPPMDDERGDVALLELATPQPASCAARLGRVALTWDRRVHALGYPAGDGLDMGVWTKMTLARHTGAEWLQMNRNSPNDLRVQRGFSGAGVADDATGDVLGIVVGEYTDDAVGLSWMLPVEAVVRHLPLVSEWVVGDTGIDAGFARSDGPPEALVEAGRIVEWLDRRRDGAAVLIVLGPDLAAARQAVALSGGLSDSGDGRAVGGVDLALDVGGRTVEEVSRRIVERAGLAADGTSSSSDRLRAGTPPMAVVLDGVDEAEQPVALVHDVLEPMVEGGARLVLGFRHDDSPSLASARALRGRLLSARIDAIAERIAVLDDVATWRMRVTALRKAAAEDPDATANAVATLEKRLRRDERRLRRARSEQETASDDRRLVAARWAAVCEHGLSEDLALADERRRVEGALDATPFDPAFAREAVLAFEAAVRAAIAGKGSR